MGRRPRRPRKEDTAEIEAAVAQIERLDHVYDAMKPTWDTIQANLQKAQPR